jgi:flavodoxin
MRALIVYFSKFGNTRRLAEAMAEAMKLAGDARAIDIDKLAASDFEGVDLVVVGSPTHAFSVPQAVRTALDALPLSILSAKSVAAFDTTVRRWPFRSLRASPKLLARLTRLGGRPIAKPETFYVHMRNPEKTGDPNLLFDGELERARQWAARLLERSEAR